MEKENAIKFNLQFFGEGGEPQPKTYSEEEYNKLKARVDEMSKNEKSLKQQLSEKMTEDEKKQDEANQLQQKLQQYESQLENITIEKELLKGGFSNEEIEKILKEKGNNLSLATTISTIFKEKLEKAKKDWETDLINKTKGVEGGSEGNEESYAVKKAKNIKKEEPQIKWGSFQK